MPDGETSSADPRALATYAEAGLRIDAELETSAIRLASALAEFSATCREYALGIDASLAEPLREHARRTAVDDIWVRRVAEQFVLADGAAFIATAAQQLQKWLGDGAEAVGEALPPFPDIKLDPNGPIARQARGQPINPFEWAQELAGYEAQVVIAGAPEDVRNARVVVQLPGFGEQTLGVQALVALALDPTNLVGMGPLEGRAAILVEKALPYLNGPARAAANRLLKGIAPELAEKILNGAAEAASRTGLSERVMTRSILKAAESSQAAEALGGLIEYGGIDELGRPMGIRAVITDFMVDNQIGTRAFDAIIPPGYQSQVPALARGHLLGKQLGGSGDVYENLVTLFQNDANTPIMSNLERRVRLAVQAGQRVEYTVTPIYEGVQVMPARLQIRAKGVLPLDAAGEALDLDVLVENVARPVEIPTLRPIQIDTLP